MLPNSAKSDGYNSTIGTKTNHIDSIPAPNSRLASLDVLRAIALFIVVASHFGSMLGGGFPQGTMARSISDALVRNGFLGTNTFFLLSAFLLVRSLSAGKSWKVAVGRRIARIYPGFAMMLAVYLFLMPLAPNVTKVPHEMGVAFMYIAANFLLLPGVFPIVPLAAIGWSLSYIVFSYLAFGLLYRVLPLTQWSPLQRAALWLGLVLSAAYFDGGRFILFPLGALLAEVSQIRGVADVRICLLDGLAGLALLVVSRNMTDSSIGLFLLVGALVSFQGGNKFLSGKYPTAIANCSYAAFLCHGFVFRAIGAAVPGMTTMMDWVVLAVAGFGVTLAVAFAANQFVLEPVRLMLLHSSAAPREHVGGWRGGKAASPSLG